MVDKLKINYHIIKSEYHMQERDFKAKDKSLEFIFKKYRFLELDDMDLLSLSQYFSSYARYDWAEKVLKSEIERIDVDEDLLFYFLNLTIIQEEYIERSSYRTILLNASNRNKERFCSLFNTITNGGISIHLLHYPSLKANYCEVCEL